MSLIGTFATSALLRKEQQLVFLLVRQLAEAQGAAGPSERSKRLWPEVAALALDPERITWLLYGGQNLSDATQLEPLDQQFTALCQQPRPPGRTRFRLPHRVGGRRSAPQATAPAHPAGR